MQDHEQSFITSHVNCIITELLGVLQITSKKKVKSNLILRKKTFDEKIRS